MNAQESSPPQPVTIANTERRVLRSAANGIEYEIDVALPRGYATSQKRQSTERLADMLLGQLMERYGGVA
jgi:hypothetical protein